MFIAGEARLSAELSRIQSNFFPAPGAGITGPHLQRAAAHVITGIGKAVAAEHESQQIQKRRAAVLFEAGIVVSHTAERHADKCGGEKKNVFPYLHDCG
jgi:hypothetical protein